MPARTNIHWADYQSNFLFATLKEETYGHACVKVSPGCEHCWASAFNTRLGTGLAYTAQNMKHVQVALNYRELANVRKFKPRPKKNESAFKWGRSRAVVFPCDMTDMFGEWVTDEMLDRMFEAMCARADVDWMILTKRPQRAAQYLYENWMRGGEKPQNFYIGCTVEDERRAQERWIEMRAIHKMGWKTWVSYEPALSHVNWMDWYFLSWMVCGGESGTQARPMNPEWAKIARDFCAANQIPFFFKQWGEFAPYTALGHVNDLTRFRHKPHTWADGTLSFRVGTGRAGRMLDGREWNHVAR